MNVHVFLGPSLSRDDIPSQYDYEFLPPIQKGDVVTSMKALPDVIGIVDGYFDQTPAVWHKEILWAITKGIPVVGSSSMGALRAAELHDFGMQGIGKVFEGFHSGELIDDDEVAISHGPAEVGYTPLSEPMVNIRETLLSAQESGVITSRDREAVIARTKRLFYPERTYQNILKIVGQEQVVSADIANELELWVQSNALDQKKLDALELLEWIDRFRRGQVYWPSVNFQFEHTEMWDQLIESY